MDRNPAIVTPTTDVGGTSPMAARFVSGYILAGRYRMIARLGRGGMGEVWRADDLILHTQVALKLIYSTDPDGRARILEEVRLARQITHPAVCRVFDVGEGEGEIFYSMELVDGEDLSTLLRRLGRLPEEKVVDIGQQLCHGLAAAHAQGVLHRDLKPANVLIDREGLVRITDFGIAVGRRETGHHTIIGTPGYMAPEQRSTGIPLSERTDIYALGLILYELLVGQPALDVRSLTPRKPAKPSALVSDVNRTLERAILNAIALDPRDRPASALEMSDLLVSGARRWSGPRMAIVGGAAALILLMLALASVFYLRPANPALTEHDTIILADFQNTTGEPVFDSALKVALAVALEQSPFIKVFPDDRVRQTLQLMQRSPDEAVTRSVAREVARREQLKALISGSIATLGSHYVLALEAISAETGDVMAREHIEVSSKEQVLSQLGTATARLREKLGESLTTLKRFDVPLAQATTASLDALHAYSRAMEQGQFVPRAEAIPHLVRALELDPNFAMAHALLSGVYSNIGRSSEAPVHAYQAFELRNRVSERERFFISWRYYRDAEQAWDKALDLTQSWTRTYPREAFAFNSLGIAAAAFGQHEQAVLAFREAIRLDPKFVPPYANLAGSLIAVNRFDEANEAVKSAAAHGLDFNAVRRMAYLRAFLSGDSRAMQRERDLLRGTPLAMWAPIWEARTSAYSGRIQAAHKLFQLGAEAARREGFDELAAQWTMEDVESHAIVGQCSNVDREVAAGLALSRDNFTLERAGRALAFCSLAAESSRLSTELRTRFANATLTMRLQLPVIAAATEVARGDFRRALEMLEPVKPYDGAPAAELWATFLRGQAYLGLNDGRAARSEFQNILDRRGAAPTSPLYPLAHLGRARAAALARDDAEARTSYERFLALWDTADPGVRALEDARRELARFR